MKRTLLFSAIVFSFAPVIASSLDSWNIDGLHGKLTVNGMMTEAPCTMDVTNSMRQEVSLGEIPSYSLRKPGDRAEPVSFNLEFRNCIRTESRMRDVRTDTPLWDAMQPVISVSFIAVSDEHFPEMLSVKGVSGLALEVTDAQREDIRLGSRGRPQFLDAPQGTLQYFVTPVRTPEKLTEGSFSAVMDFKVDYE
ncbi:type 1 fimbrial protein [Providencia rettgeri]|uniref:fimbrial protein n=1 Tax=Providencia TaxID=586 RepID=UPI0005B34CCE|nr:fimbrial protein [Providencia rettgeri]EJD6538496.1 type 1 fimbrial protein [Providencia rettgeri]EJD6671220.1 type 1 fimbrial protein [Providencia rettgeri]ELQ1455694.1 type 1 fimbrial protein [Providencia rettgeri]ELR5176888.1 type 1 fimbrial protein [Providencia rettgeri]ELR5186108.1 type 1 fimbrial protein [Providencia rettgeri]